MGPIGRPNWKRPWRSELETKSVSRSPILIQTRSSHLVSTLLYRSRSQLRFHCLLSSPIPYLSNYVASVSSFQFGSPRPHLVRFNDSVRDSVHGFRFQSNDWVLVHRCRFPLASPIRLPVRFTKVANIVSRIELGTVVADSAELETDSVDSI